MISFPNNNLCTLIKKNKQIVILKATNNKIEKILIKET
jgi:hypothetical protein